MLLALALVAVDWDWVDPRLHPFLREEGFSGRIRDIDRGMAARLRDGEADHLVYFVLQSAKFTREPRIEPALSAKEFVETGKVPEAVKRRIAAYGKRDRFDVEAEYPRAMRFLYDKEFKSRSRQGADRREWIASLYQTRGLSTDTQVDVGYLVHTALSTLRDLEPGFRARRVLIIGPGLDVAPRTGLRDTDEAQSFQPYAVLDSLLRLELAAMADVEVVGADVQPRAVAFLNGFSKRDPPRLNLYWTPGEPDHEAYFSSLARSLGGLDRACASRVNGVELNMVTQRPDPPTPFDLAIATNVLLYWPRDELLLGLNNVYRLLRPGGYFVHNDTRGEIDEFSAPLDFRPVDGRMVRMPGREGLYEAFVVHRRR